MKEIHELFVEHCFWAYECWQMYHNMCDYKVDDIEGIWARMGTIVHEYTVLQIAKINDPAKSSNDYNLSLEFFVNHCGNNSAFKRQYERFRTQNKIFIEAIKNSRHKIISHSDLETIKLDIALGEFPKGGDKDYFDSLHKIISNVLEHKKIGPFAEWPEFIIDDTKRFMKKLQIQCTTSRPS